MARQAAATPGTRTQSEPDPVLIVCFKDICIGLQLWFLPASQAQIMLGMVPTPASPAEAALMPIVS